MIEILNEIFTPEISNNILKYMSHPTAVMMKSKMKNYILYDDDGLIHFLDGVYSNDNLYNQNCVKCHKIKLINMNMDQYCRTCRIESKIRNVERINRVSIKKRGIPSIDIELYKRVLQETYEEYVERSMNDGSRDNCDW